MDDNRKKLMELMENLSFPLTPEEAEAKVKDLSDEEVTELVSVYSDIVDYEDSLEDYVREYNPDEYKKLLEDRDNAIKKKDSEATYELDRAQEEEDLKLDSEDIKAERKIDELVKEGEEAANFVESLEKDIENATKELSNQGTSENTPNSATPS